MSTYHHGDLRKALLRSSSRILEKEGLTGLSLREAACRAGVSHNAPYRHFPDRERLLAGIAAEGFAILGEALRSSSAALVLTTMRRSKSVPAPQPRYWCVGRA